MTNKILFRRALALMMMTVVTSAVFAQNDSPDYTKWHLGISAGSSIVRSESFPNIYGAHGAYFFNQKYGGGLVVRKSNFLNYEDFFMGAAFFAHWGRSNSKLFFPTRIGFGINRHTFLRSTSTMFSDYFTVNEFGGYASAGIAIRPIKFISFGINADYASSFDNMFEEYIGVTLGISVHF